MWNRIRTWLESFLWPWTAIAVLRQERDAARTELNSGRWNYAIGVNEHRQLWLSIANRQWGPNPFDSNEAVAMISFYNEGMSTAEAIRMLYIYSGRKTNGSFLS